MAESWDDELSDDFGEPKDSSQEAPNNFVGALNRANKERGMQKPEKKKPGRLQIRVRGVQEKRADSFLPLLKMMRVAFRWS